MSAEHQRYIYSNPQGGSTSYEYQAFPAQSYTSAPISQAPPRSIRSPVTQFHSQHHQTNFTPSTSYTQQASYAPGQSYALPQAQPQWQQHESWSPQFGTFPSTSIPTEVTYPPHAARPEPVSQATPAEARSYAAGPSNPPLESRRPEERYPPVPQSSNASPLQKSKRRDKESPVVAQNPNINHSLDFVKMVESYSTIIDGTRSLASAGFSARSPPPEIIERMMQSANYGSQMLRSATAQSNPDTRPSTGSSDKDIPAIKRQKAEEHTQEGQTCLGCSATSTPEWRRGPLGPRTLCNACGLVYAKLLKKRARGERSRGGNGNDHGSHTMEGSVIASSDDEDSYGSQERDLGDHIRRG
ncbi:hypothetical protein K503DRAFT_713418 [Rhizopogon vinicolor AM-OR11-026]|uniref:GATA-type domain-containing protein n=1 Tax=Rhizopogon vinicolor AM-OR11-026 TaxID=1314800 RepID=A0A1B7N865_9AGAM|nr:hypothetical protein K503DRAFT_713418 [Rhizopogon vinicolor AM-OR11-026]